jgi:hypothetical protein
VAFVYPFFRKENEMKKRERWIVLTYFAVLLIGGVSLCNGAYTQWTVSSIGGMTSSTLKAAPSGAPNTRTTIGLGEKATCSIDSSTWTDKDCNNSTHTIENDTIGDRVWASSTGGSISPSGVTSVDTVTMTADYDPDTCVVLVHVYDSETKYDDNYLQRSKTFTIIKPTGETTVTNGWVNTIMARFTSTLSPTSVNFGNISVTEVNGTGSHDGCWFTGSTMSKYEALTGGTWGVSDINVWGDDHLSWSAADIVYYRNEGRAPCNTSIAQEMHVVEGSSGEYTNGNLVLTIGTTTISASRNGASLSKSYP